jgi:prevent-host-death family protein
MMMNMLEAKTHLSKLVEAALRGEEVVIANRGKPVVKLVKAEPERPKPRWGFLAGQISEEAIEAAFSPEVKAAERAMWEESMNKSIFPPEKPRGNKTDAKGRAKPAKAKPTAARRSR